VFVYNTESKKTSSSSCQESADVSARETENLPTADRHLSGPRHPI